MAGRADVASIILEGRKLKFKEKAIRSSALHSTWRNKDLTLALRAFIFLIAGSIHQQLPLCRVLTRVWARALALAVTRW